MAVDRHKCCIISAWLLLCLGLALVTGIAICHIAYPPDSGLDVQTHVRSQAEDIQRKQRPENVLHGEELQAAVAAHHPLNRLQCGNWMSEYASLHHAILSGQAPQRYAIMRSRMKYENGLADRLVSSVSIFLYALLSRRAFQYDWEGDSPLWDELQSEFIDWRYTGWDVGNDTVILDYVDKPKGSAPWKRYFEFFESDNLTQIEEAHHSVVWFTDHGRVVRAFDNPLLAGRLAELGLRRETAFACLFDFLFRPTPRLLEMFAAPLTTLLDPGVLRIGIQIRVGDWQLTDNFLFGIHRLMQGAQLFRHYFECAGELEAELTNRNTSGAAPQTAQRVMYFVLADSSRLRYALQVDYGEKVLINLGAPIEHISKSKQYTAAGFQHAVAEVWMFSLTQAQVITKKSGFGKLGAMVAVQDESAPLIFSIDYPMNFYGWLGFDNRKNLGLYRRRHCRRTDADNLTDLATTFTGI